MTPLNPLIGEVRFNGGCELSYPCYTVLPCLWANKNNSRYIKKWRKWEAWKTGEPDNGLLSQINVPLKNWQWLCNFQNSFKDSLGYSVRLLSATFWILQVLDSSQAFDVWILNLSLSHVLWTEQPWEGCEKCIFQKLQMIFEMTQLNDGQQVRRRVVGTKGRDSNLNFCACTVHIICNEWTCVYLSAYMILWVSNMWFLERQGLFGFSWAVRPIRSGHAD